jgi:hypothetical protein
MKMHSQKDCCVKVEALKGLMMVLRNSLTDPSLQHICDSGIDLIREIKGEFDDVQNDSKRRNI